MEAITSVKVNNSAPSCKYDKFAQQLQSHLETQDELMIDFSSLQSCLNPTGYTPENEEGEDIGEDITDKDFDYQEFTWNLLENQEKSLPNLKKLSVTRILELKHPTVLSLEHHDKYAKLTYSMVQMSSLSELHIKNLPSEYHSYLQFWGLQNLESLSITSSQLSQLPSSVGSLRKLKSLNLSSNQLRTLPITLSFCNNLETLDLQYNSFSCLPSVLMQLKSLTNLKRHGCPLSPRFSWHGPKYVNKEKPTPDSKQPQVFQPLTLQESCTKEVFTLKLDYWETRLIGVMQCRTLDYLAEKFFACDNCHRMLQTAHSTKYTVRTLLLTFKGLSGVPVIFHACSEKCSEDLADTYGELNIALQKELDIKYDNDVKKAQEDMKNGLIPELPDSGLHNYTPHPAYARLQAGRNHQNRGRRRKKCTIM